MSLLEPCFFLEEGASRIGLRGRRGIVKEDLLALESLLCVINGGLWKNGV